jgi:4-hydroxy-3-polyprenylbenzoate decarboxylase
MAFADLQELLAALERDGDLTRVRTPVDPHLEVTGIVQRVLAEQGPALLFENPTRGSLPLAINVFGTQRRMARALGVSRLDEIGERIGELLRPELPRGIGGLRDALGKAAQLRSLAPRRVTAAPCQEIVFRADDVDLSRLPGIKSWPDDGGVFLNLGLTHTKHPETGARNLGLYRLQVQDPRTVSLHWQIHKDSTSHAAVGERRGEPLPVAIAFGCAPAVTYAASAPLPAGIDEYLFAGFLARSRIELVDCVSVPLRVPATAQVVLEGWVQPGERLPEGPFGDHTGFYTPVEPFPYVRVETMTMRADAIYQSIIVGRPPQEDGPIGKATERIFLPLLRLSVPEIVDYDLPEAGVFHNCVIVSIEKRFPKHAQKVMNAIWGAGLMSLSKLVVVVDADCDVHDYAEVAWRAFGNVDYAHDALHTVGPVDHLDHASYEQFFGGKLGLDATRKLPSEGYRRGWPAEAVLDAATLDRVRRRWSEYGIS